MPLPSLYFSAFIINYIMCIVFLYMKVREVNEMKKVLDIMLRKSDEIFQRDFPFFLCVANQINRSVLLMVMRKHLALLVILSPTKGSNVLKTCLFMLLVMGL